MSKIDNGGPAFPVHETDEHRQPYCTDPGLTLRDYFAAKAMVGLFSMEANPRVGVDVEPFRANSREHLNGIAMSAYRVADAMLAARKAGGS